MTDQTNPATERTCVFISGAGPTGLMAALILAKAGVPTRVVDAKPGPIEQSRALAVQARTLELWHKLGLDEQALAGGRKVEEAFASQSGSLLNHGKPLLRFPTLGSGVTPYPYLLVFEHSKTERLLLDHLQEAGGAVEWSTKVSKINIAPDAVEVTTLDRAGATTRCRADWIIGADGASSIVRRTLGLPFDGDTYEQAFFLADVALDWTYPNQMLLTQTDTATFLFLPMPTETNGQQRFRILASVPQALTGKPELTLGDVQQAIDHHSGIQAAAHDPRWISIYRLHHRLAPQFRVGRAFLAGDAGHIHSPVGGQGMNTGLQDAYNLAWKLALVCAGHADPALLESYQAERHPVAEALVSGTDNAFNSLTRNSTAAHLIRRIVAQRLLPQVLRIPRLGPALFSSVSQTSIRYPNSPTIDTASAAKARHGRGARPGDRAPWAPFLFGDLCGSTTFDLCTGLGHHLIVVSGTDNHADLEAASLTRHLRAGLITVHLIGRKETLIRESHTGSHGGLVLIRPDGYISWRGRLGAHPELDRHLQTWLATPPADSSHQTHQDRHV